MILIAPYGEGLRVWCSRCPWYLDIEGWMPEGVPLDDVNHAARHTHDASVPLDTVSRETGPSRDRGFFRDAPRGHPALSRVPLPAAPNRDGS